MKPMPQPLLTLDNLGRRFADRWIFQSLNWEIREGEIAVLTGPNGSGKTTLLKVLATLLTPSEGDAVVGGKSLLRSAKGVRRAIGWVPATDGGFFSRLCGRENLLLHAYLRNIGRKEFNRRLGEIEKLPTLNRALSTPYCVCSAGMKQTLHIARAWLGHPAVLLLDEPTRSLDKQTRSEIGHLLTQVGQKSAVLLSSHTESDWEGVPAKKFELGGHA